MSERTLPRNTQYDQLEYTQTTGIKNNVPTSKNAWVLGSDADCQSVKTCGTIMGQRLIAMPRYEITNRPIAPKNGTTWPPLFNARHSVQAMMAVRIGMGAR